VEKTWRVPAERVQGEPESLLCAVLSSWVASKGWTPGWISQTEGDSASTKWLSRCPSAASASLTASYLFWPCSPTFGIRSGMSRRPLFGPPALVRSGCICVFSQLRPASCTTWLRTWFHNSNSLGQSPDTAFPVRIGWNALVASSNLLCPSALIFAATMTTAWGGRRVPAEGYRRRAEPIRLEDDAGIGIRCPLKGEAFEWRTAVKSPPPCCSCPCTA
jgi:hypothetical protein